jgi:hypothetical protein
MTMKRYRYEGPLSGVSFNDGTSVQLSPGAEVDLPSDLRYVQALVDRKHLQEVTKTATVVPPKADGESSSSGPRSQRAPKASKSINNAEAPADAAKRET